MVKVKKKAITLLEIMIVIVIIGVISSVIGFNMKGSLDAGRSFATERGSKEIHDILTLKVSEGIRVEELSDNILEHLEESDIVANPKKLLKDGWKKNYQIIPMESGEFCVYSKNWRDYLEKKKHMTLEKMEEEYPWAFHSSMDEILLEEKSVPHENEDQE